MRGAIAGLTNPVALRHRIPGVLQDDEFTCRFLDAFDAGFAPVIATLDGLAGYVDPWLAPEDFLDWLSGWVGIELDDAWTLEQRRTIVAGAALVHRQKGTAAGVAEALRLALDAEVTVLDSGGCSWSSTPGGEVPGEEVPSMVVRIEVAEPDKVDVRRVEALIEAVKPAHVVHTTDLVPRSRAGSEAKEET